MRQQIGTALLFLLTTAAFGQESSRDVTREKVREVLNASGDLSDVGVTFQQATQQPYNFSGTMSRGLSNAEKLEVVVRVTTEETIAVRVYPHYKDGYINLKKVKDRSGLMHRLLAYNDSNFLFWGVDESDDVFAGYSFTLESGFPEEALIIVLRSVRSSDGFVGELRPYIDGSKAAPERTK